MVNILLQADIKDLLYDGCDNLGAALVDACKKFVDDYLPQIMVLLEQELNPTAICTEFGICPATVMLLPPKLIAPYVPPSEY